MTRKGYEVISFRPSARFDKASTLVLINQQQLKSKKFAFNKKDLENEISAVQASGQFSAEKGQVFPLLHKKKLVLLLGLGKTADLSLTELRIFVRRTLLSPYLNKAKDIEIVPSEQNESAVKAVIEGAQIGTYRWEKYKTKSKADKTPRDKTFHIVAAKKPAYQDAVKVCEGVNLARDLINDNADTVNASYIEKTVRGIVKGHKNVSLQVLNRKEMKVKGLNLHLAVNQGSQNEPKLVIVKYSGGAKNAKYTAVIGKGITFDTGGLNLKPSGHIETMRCDMSGAAAVVGTLKNTLALKLKRNIIFAVGLAENATDSKSYKPGDVFKSYSGKTVEVGNTDAEGRLVLADAISYVVKNHKPERIIDIATLTGACVIALGYDYTGLVTSDDKFARQIVRSSNDSDDRVWRLPSYPELKDSVKSQIADIRNLGFPRGAGGTITAAEFLRQFTEDTTWAHLDIAGTAFVDGRGRMYFGHGATGAGVRLLTEYFTKNN